MFVRFETETGSIYEVDYNKKMARRLCGKASPTPRQGNDGDWKEWDNCSDITEGKSVMFIWNWDTEPKGEMIGRSTVTSAVKKIHLNENDNDTRSFN